MAQIETAFGSVSWAMRKKTELATTIQAPCGTNPVMDTFPKDSPGDPGALLANLVWTRGLAQSLVRGSERAEELVQETWWRVLRNPAPDGVPERSWIAGVMRRVVLDTARSASRRKRREEAFAHSRPESIDERHDQALLVHKELVEHVMELDGPLRRVVLLRYFDGLGLREIATSEGLQVSGVRSRLERAHERLRSRLGEHPESPAGALLVLARKGAAAAASAGPPALVVFGHSLPFVPLAMKALIAAAALALTVLFGLRLTEETDGQQLALVEPSGTPSESLVVDLAGTEQKSVEGRKGASPERQEPPVAAQASTLAMVQPSSAPRLEILVVDEQGKPVAGAPLLVSPIYSLVGWEGETGPNGLASVDSSFLLSKAKGRWAGEFRATLAAPCGKEGTVSVDLNKLPVDTVRLVAPAARGGLELRFLNPEGAEFLGLRRCSLSTTHSVGGLTEIVRNPSGTSGTVSFDFLPLGEVFDVDVLVPAPWTLGAKTVIGPTQVGEVVQVDLPLRATRPTIMGRFTGLWTDASGRMATVEAKATLHGGEPEIANVLVQLEEDSCFNAFVGGSKQPGRPCTYTFTLTDSTSKQKRPSLQVNVEGVIPEPGEVIQLGDLALQEAIPDVRGRVVDQQGNPVARARVSIRDVDGPDPGRVQGIHSGVLTDRDGWFELVGFPGEGTFGLEARAHGMASRRTDAVAHGSQGVEIVLDPALEIRGQILPCEGLNADSLYVFLSRVEESGDGDVDGVGIQPDWSFLSTNLASGEYKLEISGKQGTLDLVVIPELHPVAPGESQDIRLATIDLRDVARAVNLRVSDGVGEPIQEIHAQSGQSIMSGEAGVLDCVLARDQEWLTVAARGFAPIDLELANLPEQVQLEAGLAVDLVVPESWPAGAGRDQVTLQLSPQGLELANDYPSGALPRGTFPEAGTLRLVVPAAGRYFLYWTGRRVGGGFMSVSEIIQPLGSQWIEVIPSLDPQVFHLGAK